MDTYKICPECRAEYQPRALNCADCQVSLVWPRERPEPVSVSESGWDAFAEKEILGQLAADRQRVIEACRGYLQTAGITAAILPQTAYQPRDTRLMYSPVFGTALRGGKAGQVPVGDVAGGFSYLLFVRQHDYEAARRIVAQVFADLPSEPVDGHHREFELGACPACGAAVTEDAADCPDCGLNLG